MISCSLTTGLVSLSGVAFGAVVLGGSYFTVRGNRSWFGRGSSLPVGGVSEHIDDEPAERPSTDPSSDPTTAARPRVLDVLPQDERQILKPVLASPGITQSELRDRADFSKAKISQTVTDLEKRGLLYREEYGRTYRIYPDDSLQ